MVLSNIIVISGIIILIYIFLKSRKEIKEIETNNFSKALNHYFENSCKK